MIGYNFKQINKQGIKKIFKDNFVQSSKMHYRIKNVTN